MFYLFKKIKHWLDIMRFSSAQTTLFRGCCTSRLLYFSAAVLLNHNQLQSPNCSVIAKLSSELFRRILFIS